MFKKDNFRLGLLLGLLAPIISFFGYYYWKFRLYTFNEFFYALRTNKPLITAITIPCLLLNIILFTVYINSRKDQTAKGIFAVTLIYAVASLLFKFIS